MSAFQLYRTSWFSQNLSSFSVHIVNIWNSLPNDVVDVNNVNQFKARLDKFWMHQDAKFDFTADLTKIGDTRRSVRVICDV